MNLICLDLEGALVPEIWINVSEATEIDELPLTTRDVADYDELMRSRRLPEPSGNRMMGPTPNGESDEWR